MELNEKMRELDAQYKVLKNQVHATLLDIRESILDRRNPFNDGESASATQSVHVITSGQGHTNGNEGPSTPEDAPRAEAGGDAEAKAAPEVAPKSGDLEPADATPVATPEPPAATPERTVATPGPAEEAPSLPAPYPPSYQNGHASGEIELATIAGLARWADAGIQRIGKERLKAIIKVYQTARQLPRDLDKILNQLADLAEKRRSRDPVTMGDCIAVLVQLDALLGPGASSDAALLSLLLEGQVREGTWTR